MTVLAVVSAVATRRPVLDARPFVSDLPVGARPPRGFPLSVPFIRPLNATEIAWRVASWGNSRRCRHARRAVGHPPPEISPPHTAPVGMLAVAVIAIARSGPLVLANRDPSNNLRLFPGFFGITSLIIVPFALMGFRIGRRALTIRIVLARALAEVLAIVAA